MCGSCCLAEFLPVSELLPPVCFKVRNSTSARKMRGTEEVWEKEVWKWSGIYAKSMWCFPSWRAFIVLWWTLELMFWKTHPPHFFKIGQDWSFHKSYFTGLRQMQSMSGSEPEEKVNHLCMKLQYTSTIRRQTLVLEVISLLQRSTTQVCILLCVTVNKAAWFCHIVGTIVHLFTIYVLSRL